MAKRIFSPLIISLLTAFCNILPAEAIFIREYTEDRPLVIVCDWEFPPYEYRNDRGEADGYNIAVLSTILQKLNIPYRFEMKEWYQAIETFNSRQADLIHALAFIYNERPFVMTQNMITFYPVKVARLRGTKAISHLSDLGTGDTLCIKKNDYVELRLKEHEDIQFAIEFHNPREALSGIRNGKYKYAAWGEIPLSLKIKELDLDNIVLDNIDIPAGELRIIGYDKELIDAIDDGYARLEQSGELELIRDKYFHPERIHNDTSPLSLFILVGIIILLIIFILMSRLIRVRVKQAVRKTFDLNQMMNQALNMGDYYVVEYDFQTDRIRNLHGSLLPQEGLTVDSYLANIHEDERSTFHEEIREMAEGKKSLYSIHRRWNMGTDEAPDWRFLEGHAVAEQEDGKTRYLIGTLKDLTPEIQEERLTQEMGMKYRKLFETNLIAMSFYDKEGNFINVNENMRKLCELDGKGLEYFSKTNLFSVPLLKGQIDPQSHDNFYVCQHMHYPDWNLDKYVEFKIRPIVDDNDELQFYLVTALDATEERNTYLNQRQHDKQIISANEAIEQYEKQLHYLLDNSQMFIWSYYPDTDEITFSRNIRQNIYKETLEEFFEGVVEDKPGSTIEHVRATVAKQQPFEATHHYSHTPLEPHQVWYAISGLPQFDAEGHLTHYFGLSRNITSLMVAQERLKEETERANNSGKMKSAFLANMTHEIRTPLNAIVGFSDLLPVVETNEERLQFIRIIRNNCDMLMRLINDILEASNMGQALAILPEEIDIAKAFDDMCQTLEQRVQEPGVTFIKDNPYESYITYLDKGRIQQLLTNFVTNAVKYTHQGHIKVGYREETRIPKGGTNETNGLYFYCEDTGAGIPKEKQASVFERFVKLNEFVQGTGLGLSICKAIVDHCDGQIGVTSEGEGTGSTFWIWIPCEHKQQ